MEDLLVKYVRNECNREEEQWVIGWLQNPDNEAYLRGLMRKQWNNPCVTDVDSPNWQRMWLDISQQTKHVPTEPELPLYRTVWQQVIRIAIWVTCIIALGFSIRLLRQAQLPADAVYQSGDKPYRHILLPDKSAVILRKNSTVKVSSDWSGPNRKIWLNGEAVVLVARQPLGFRLQIHTGNHVVTETQEARVYVNRKKQSSQVIVEEGTVNFILQKSGLLDKMKEYKLERGDMAEYNEGSTQLIRRHVKPSAYTSWTKEN
ncbi:FecR family protein [Larkinella insperata]|uniref:FecR family protein n=1 Tax=Larkinella insperata TaxID=332158 RepID=A0ABW3QIJ1_9BACT|nr:FecR family protein [Larkinella insperata]